MESDTLAMDPTSFAAPSRVRTLVVPAAPLAPVQFAVHVDRLRGVARVPLCDVRMPAANETGIDTSPFEPSIEGVLTFAIETAAMPPSHNVLLDLEPFRRQMLVIGVAHTDSDVEQGLDAHGLDAANHEADLAVPAQDVAHLDRSAITTACNALRRQYPSALCHALLVFGAPPSTAHIEWPSGTYPVVNNDVTQVMSIVAGKFLYDLAGFWTTRHLNSFQSPLAMQPKAEAQNEKRQRIRRNHNLTVGRNGSISMTSAENARSRQDGRSRKFLGSLLLLAGRTTDALVELGAAAALLRDSGDHLWFGSALTEIALCLVKIRIEEGTAPLVPSAVVAAAWSAALREIKKDTVPASVTPISHTSHPHQSISTSSSTVVTPDPPSTASTVTPKASNVQSDDVSTNSSPRSSIILSHSYLIMPRSTLKKSKSFTESTPVEVLLEFIISAALDEFAAGQDEDLVPYTVYYEAVARYAGFLVCLRHFDWAGALDGIAEAAQIAQAADRMDLSEGGTPMAFVDAWIMRVYDLSTDLSPDTQAKILGTVARLYAAAGMRRKWAFSCTQIVTLLASSSATVDADLGEVENVLQVYSCWPKLEASMLRKLVALGQRIRNPQLRTAAASRLLQIACTTDIAANPILNSNPVSSGSSSGSSSNGVPVPMTGLNNGSAAAANDNHASVPVVARRTSSRNFYKRSSSGATEQMTMYHLIRSYGDVVQSPFWDKEILVDANVRTHRLTTMRTPRVNSGHSAVGIIYNPFEGTETKEENSVEAGVPTKASVWLRNPLAVDLQVFEMVLVVDAMGTPASSQAKNFVVPAQSDAFRIDVSVTPSNQSKLVVYGCQIQVSGCKSEIYALASPLAFPIIPARPSLALQELSLTKGWSMLLEGEVRRFSIELWNNSQTPSDVLHFGYSDSTVDMLRQAASRQDVSRTDFYECEFFLHKRRAVQFLGTSDSEPPRTSPDLPFVSETHPGEHAIAARASKRFYFELYGKRGINCAAVLIDYGLNEDSLRRLKIPLQITINPCVSIERANIMHSTSASCILLVIDVHNSWRERVQCSIWAKARAKPEPVQIEPHAMHRLLIEVPWESPNAVDLAKPIPSLSKRQYTVDHKSTPEQVQMFWLREKLLERMRGEWNTADRHGYIEMRVLQLSRRMADILRTSAVNVSAELVNIVPDPSGTKMSVGVGQQSSLRVTIENMSGEEVQGMLRFAPTRLTQRYVLVMGCPQQLVTIEAQSSATVDFELTFLCRGTIELSTIFDIPTGPVYQTNKTIVHI